jgi:thiol-disulfide isomerase/thioredoxin
MKFIKIILVIFFSISLFSCNKSNKTDSQDSKDTKTTTQQTNNDENKGPAYKFFKITKSEASGKDSIPPEITWNENGKDVKLSELKGNVVLVNLWATWCKPCVGEMPDLSTISQELKAKNFRILGISNEDSKTIENFLKTKPVDYPILNGTEQTFEVLGKSVKQQIDGIPATFIINKEGKIVQYIVGAKSKQAFLDLINKYL